MHCWYFVLREWHSYSICTVNNIKNKKAGKFPLLAYSRINCHLRVEKKSVFVRVCPCPCLCSFSGRCMPHVDDWSSIGCLVLRGDGRCCRNKSHCDEPWSSVSIRLSAIVRQRIGINRRLVTSIVKYLVTIIRLRRYFSIAGGTVKKKSRWSR